MDRFLVPWWFRLTDENFLGRSGKPNDSDSRRTVSALPACSKTNARIDELLLNFLPPSQVELLL